MPDVDPTEVAQPYLTRLEQQILECLAQAPGAAARAARAAVSEEVHQLTATVAQRAERLLGILSRLPHHVAEGVLDLFRDARSMRVPTPGERSNAIRAFGQRASVLAGKTWISDGPGNNPIALVAFYNDHPAITFGNTIYCKPTFWKADFAASRSGLPLFLHEFTHVVQWDRLGVASFIARFTREARRFGGDGAYDYAHRNTDFGHETLEGQAQMVEDYTIALHGGPGADKIMPDLKRRLAGSQVYGL